MDAQKWKQLNAQGCDQQEETTYILQIKNAKKLLKKFKHDETHQTFMHSEKEKK